MTFLEQLYKQMITDVRLYIQDNFSTILIKLLGAVTIFFVIKSIINIFVKKAEDKVKANAIVEDTYTIKLASLVGSIVFVSLMIFNVLIVFMYVGFDVGIIMGAISIAIGFAMETTIKNMISGILLLTNKKFKLGDFVEILGSFNIRGTIKEINMRNTIIETLDKRKVLIPNGELASTPIKTIKSEKLIRGTLDVHTKRNVDIAQIKQLINSIINSHNYVLHKAYTTTFVSGFDAQGIHFKTYFYLDPQQDKSTFVIGSEVRTELHKIFKKYGIQVAYLNYVWSIHK